MKETTRYLIGDVANLIGVSRDTLRYYEKRGILASKKADNGYRYYTDQDISHLVSILYQRKMNISLEDMESLWSGGDTILELSDMIDSRLKEEERAMRAHRQTIARLRLTSRDCKRIRHQLNHVSVKDFPSAHVIVPQTNIKESNGLWFQMAKEYPGLDMMYVFDEYHDILGMTSPVHQNTQLVLYQELAPVVDYECSKTPVIKEAGTPCLYSFRASATRTPNRSDIFPMLAWAKEKGLTLSNQLFSTYAMQGVKDGAYIYYLELYIPLISPLPV